MKFFTNIRLLVLGVWIGAAVFFIGVAQNAFIVLTQRDLAGAVVGRDLALLNYGGLGIAAFLIVTSLVGVSKVNKFWLWIERFLLLLLGAACTVSQFVISFWMGSIKTQLGRPIDEVATDDPLRVQFDTLHQYSTWVYMAAVIAALITFFILSNRRFDAVATDKADKTEKADPYDFSKEFKT
jgi:hypothetical protein